MIEKYGLFDSVEGDEREYAEVDFARLARALGQDGVRGAEDALQVKAAASGLAVTVEPGLAVIQGRCYELMDDGSGAFTLGLTAAGSSPRIDRIVLTLDFGERTATLGVLPGEEAASPAAPALERSTARWMLSLAQVKVAVGAAALTDDAVTDERADETLCGLHCASAQSAMTAALAAQQSAQNALAKAGVTSVNGLTGAVKLTAASVGAMPDTYSAPVTSVGGKTGAVALSAGSGISVSGVTITNSGVRSLNGKTGAVTLDEGEADWVLLWQNASPTSTFAAQTVSLSLGSYSALLIVFKNVSAGSVVREEVVPVNGGRHDLFMMDGLIRMRSCTSVSTSGVTFGLGRKFTSYGSSSGYTEEADSVIPVTIYGLKGAIG